MTADGGRDHDADVVAGRATPGVRPRLDRDQIVTTALDFIAEHGLPGLTMRRLGERLDVEAMSLYNHVPGKEDLLDAVVESLLTVMDSDADVYSEPRAGWQDFLQRLAHGLRRMALTNPNAFPLVVSRPVEAPWLRPPLRSLQWVENFLAGLISEGFSPDAAVHAYRGFTSFLLGHLLLEVASIGADVGPLDVLDDGSLMPDGLSQFPTLSSLQAPLAEDRSALEFDEALESLLDRLALLRAESSPSD